MKRLLPCLIILLLSAAAASSQGSAPGVLTLRYNLGAAAGGMGNAYTTVTDDTDALFYNPAGLIDIDDLEFMAMYQTVNGGSEYYGFAFGCPYERGGNFGLGTVIYRKPGEQEDQAGILSYSADVSEKLTAGAGIKSVISRLMPGTTTAMMVCFDAGCIYTTSKSKKSVSKAGVSLQNFGTELRYSDGRRAPFINTLRLGWSNESTVSHWTGNTYDTLTSIDVARHSDSSYVEFNFGFGFKFTKVFTMRMGFSFYGATSTGNMGAGFRIPCGKNNNIELDLVSVSTRDLDAQAEYTTYRVSIRTGIEFNPEKNNGKDNSDSKPERRSRQNYDRD